MLVVVLFLAVVTASPLDADYRMPYPAVLSRPIIVTGSDGTVLFRASSRCFENWYNRILNLHQLQEFLIGRSLRDQDKEFLIIFLQDSLVDLSFRFITLGYSIRSGESIPNYISCFKSCNTNTTSRCT